MAVCLPPSPPPLLPGATVAYAPGGRLHPPGTSGVPQGRVCADLLAAPGSPEGSAGSHACRPDGEVEAGMEKDLPRTTGTL